MATDDKPKSPPVEKGTFRESVVERQQPGHATLNEKADRVFTVVNTHPVPPAPPPKTDSKK